MRKLLIIAALALAGCGQVATNVDDGAAAQGVDVGAYECSTTDTAQCECERSVVAAGTSPEEAPAACAN